MFRDMTLGQFYPGNSFLHRADPRIKIIALLLFLVFSLLAENMASLGLVLLFTVLLAAVSRIPVSVLLRSLKPLAFLLLFTGVINLFFTTGETPLFEWRFLHIYPEGVRTAAFVLIRLLSLVAGSSLLLSFTTSSLELADALESLLSPLKKLKIPVHDFSMMMTIALRFIPTLSEETQKIVSAQKARGADLESGGLIRKCRALIPILLPLLVSAFRRAEELADAMECRCYRGGEGRTKLRVMRARPSDFAFLAFVLCICAGILLANRFGAVTVQIWNITL